jgi:hypothetical protein
MPIAHASIPTTHASQYLVAVCRHASRMSHRILARHGGDRANRPQVSHVDWTDTDGTLELNWGHCTFHAGPDELTVRIEAADDEHLEAVQQIIARDLERYGRREDLSINWRRQPAPSTTPTDQA